MLSPGFLIFLNFVEKYDDHGKLSAYEQWPIDIKDGNNGYFPLVTAVDNGFRGILLF
jgi:hypothetical protein